MKKIAKTKKRNKAKKAITSEQKFQQALEKLKRFTSKNQKLAGELVELRARILPAVKDAESTCLTASFQLALKLASFVDKKSLAEYYREELIDWIIGLRHEIVASPFSSQVDPGPLDCIMETAFESLGQHHDQKLKKKLRKQGFSEEQIQDAFDIRDQSQPSEEDIETFFEELFAETEDEDNTPDADENELQEDLFGYDKEEEIDNSKTKDKAFNFEGIDAENPFSQFLDEEEQTEKQIENLLNGKAMKTLFRRIAKASHPDLAQSPEEKEERHHKMSELLKARDEKDIPTIFRHYTETVGEIPSDIFSGNIKQVTNIIEQRIEALRDQQFILEQNHPELLLYYEFFYAPTPAKERQNVKNYKAMLREKTDFNINVSNRIRNLATLKAFLDERYHVKTMEDFPMWD